MFQCLFYPIDNFIKIFRININESVPFWHCFFSFSFFPRTLRSAGEKSNDMSHRCYTLLQVWLLASALVPYLVSIALFEGVRGKTVKIHTRSHVGLHRLIQNVCSQVASAEHICNMY